MTEGKGLSFVILTCSEFKYTIIAEKNGGNRNIK